MQNPTKNQKMNRETNVLKREGYGQILVRKGIYRLLMFVLTAMMMLPIMWIISTSLRVPGESFRLPPSFFPTSFNWRNYVRVFTDVPFFSFILNSIRVSTITIVLQLIFSTLAAYAFARIEFKGRTILFLTILAGLMVPGQAVIVPRFLVIISFGMMDSHSALIIPALADPLGIFILRQFMLTIPKSYDEAAYIDGASRFRIYSRIILPMSKPCIVIVLIMRLIAVWNDFFNPLIFINTFDRMTLPLGLTILDGFMGTGNVSVILAGVTLSLIPPLLVYIFGQKYLLQGTTLTGLKS